MKLPKLIVEIPQGMVIPKGYAIFNLDYYSSKAQCTWYGLHVLFAIVLAIDSKIFRIGVELTDTTEGVYRQGHRDGQEQTTKELEAEFADRAETIRFAALKEGHTQGFSLGSREGYNKGFDAGWRKRSKS